MMLPPISCSTMARATRWVHRITCLRLDRYRASQPFSVVSRRGEKKTPPALFTRMLTGPSSATVRSERRIDLARTRARRSVMPRPPTSSAAAAAVSALRLPDGDLRPERSEAVRRCPGRFRTHRRSRRPRGRSAVRTRGRSARGDSTVERSLQERDRRRRSARESLGVCMPRIEPIPMEEMAPEPRRIIEEGVADGTVCHADPAADLRLQDVADPDDERRPATPGASSRCSGAGSSSCCGSAAPSWASASPACSRGSTIPSPTRTWPASSHRARRRPDRSGAAGRGVPRPALR